MIPTLDWADFSKDPDVFAMGIGGACRKTGCFLLTGHGISSVLQEQAFREIDRLFDLPRADKSRLVMRQAPRNRGWFPISRDPRDTTDERVYRKETFLLGPDIDQDDATTLSRGQSWAPNLWPDLPGFRATVIRYFVAVLKLGVDLHSPLARDLGKPSDYFRAHFVAPRATMRLERFLPGISHGRELGGATRTGKGSLTLILMDDQPRLQVRSAEGWITVPHAPGAFVVTIGEDLTRCCGGYIPPPQRVLSPTRRGRWISLDICLS